MIRLDSTIIYNTDPILLPKQLSVSLVSPAYFISVTRCDIILSLKGVITYYLSCTRTWGIHCHEKSPHTNLKPGNYTGDQHISLVDHLPAFPDILTDPPRHILYCQYSIWESMHQAKIYHWICYYTGRHWYRLSLQNLDTNCPQFYWDVPKWQFTMEKS